MTTPIQINNMNRYNSPLKNSITTIINGMNESHLISNTFNHAIGVFTSPANLLIHVDTTTGYL